MEVTEVVATGLGRAVWDVIAMEILENYLVVVDQELKLADHKIEWAEVAEVGE
jgi:hypothetical protein